MGIIEDIKKSAVQSGAKIQTSESAQLEKILNRMFYLEHNIEMETQFINQVMTRSTGTQERSGLHASSVIESDNKYCPRRQVLALCYKQLQGEQVNIGLKRIFEEGNAVHEKWQRLFLRAGYARPNTLDRTRYNSEYQLSYSPDIVCRIPEFYNGAMVVEIKSVNPMQFKRMDSHPSAKRQLQLYMYLCMEEAKKRGKWNGKDYMKGFVLCDDKGAQEFKTFIYDYDPDFIRPYIKRLAETRQHYNRFIEAGRLVPRSSTCSGYNCKQAETCPMKDACYNMGMGRVDL